MIQIVIRMVSIGTRMVKIVTRMVRIVTRMAYGLLQNVTFLLCLVVDLSTAQNKQLPKFVFV